MTDADSLHSRNPNDDNGVDKLLDTPFNGLSNLNADRTVMWTTTDRAGRSSSVRIVHRARSRSPRRQVGEAPMPQAAAEPHAESPDYTPGPHIIPCTPDPPVGESYPGWVQVNTGGNMERVFVKDGSIVWGDWKHKQWLFHATPDRHPSDWDDMGFHPGL